MLRVRNPWWIVAACVCALMCSGGPVNIWTFGVFLKPVAEALHIARSDLAGALAVAGFVSAVLAPLSGLLLDRFGGRPVLLIGIALFAAVTAMQSLMTVRSMAVASLGTKSRTWYVCGISTSFGCFAARNCFRPRANASGV